MEIGYSGVTASAVETSAYGDNQNIVEVFLDGNSTGRQVEFGYIFRLFPGMTPTTVNLTAISHWSQVGAIYTGAFVADSVTTVSYSESRDGTTNPSDSFDQNPAPIAYEVSPGWTMD